MKKYLLALTLAILFTVGCANATIIPVQVQTTTQPYCREFTQTKTIGSETQAGYGTACLQPDGTWEIQKPATTANTNNNLNYIIREERVYVAPPRPYTVLQAYPRVRYDYPHHNHRRHNRWEYRGH